ncbi:MAG: response regulator transcription factor, partial [Vicingus serpentipes]|nr:response regulator transcription factor [Vicingus serpentipes]
MEKTDRKLSKQELKVVILLSQGYTQSQIAKKLYVSLETIRT